MGARAFLARSGWRETPITAEEWKVAASGVPELVLHHDADSPAVKAVLRGSHRRRLTWHDGYVAAHHANPALVAALFVLADRLGAQVYSEQRRRYADVADWERSNPPLQRTRSRVPVTASAALPAAAANTAWVPWLAFLIALGVVAAWNTF